VNTRNIPEVSAINQGLLKGILALWEIIKKKIKKERKMQNIDEIFKIKKKS